MSSAANDKRGHLESEFQRRMHDAEASPSPDLWARIDHDLTIQESKHYKGRMVWYRQLAAACFVLFILAGALLTYTYKTTGSIDAGIAAMQLNTETGGAAAEMATTGAAPVAPGMAESATSALEQSMAAAAEVTTAPLSDAVAVAKATINRTDTKQAVEQSINTNASGDYRRVQSAGTAQYNLHATTDKPSAAIAAGQSSYGGNATGSETNHSSHPAAKSLFDIGRPFFQTARQAITAVPPAFRNTADQSMATETGRTRSLVELSQKAVTDYLSKEEKTAEQTLALNGPVAESTGKADQEAKKEGRWSLGLGYAPSYFNQNIQMPGQMMGTVSRYSLLAGGPDKSAQTSENMNEARDEFEANTDPAFSYAAEVKAGLRLGKKIKLLAGLGFTQNTARTKSSYIIKQFLFKPGTDERVEMPGTTVFLPSLNNNFTTDSLSVSKTDKFYVNYRYRHITVPVGLQYEGNISNNWFWYTSGGVAANFLIETTVMASTSEVKDVQYDHNDNSPFRKVQFSGNVSAGFGKRISNAVSVTAGPEFRGYLNSLLAEPDKALAPQGNPYTIGVNMSVNYNLGQK